NVSTSGSYGDISVLGIPVVTEQDLGSEDLEEITLSLDTSTFGIKANYQLLDGFGIPVLFRWNGISLGTGFIANTFNVNAKLENLMSLLAGDSEEESTFDVSSFKVGAEFAINNSTYTIPFEASTGIQVLSVLTLTAGAGIDLTFGTSSVEFTTIYEDPDALVAKVIDEIINQALIESGTGINFPYSNPGNINLINPRLMAGVGLGIGPAVVDFTVGYYIFSGTTFGINFVLRI
ncbi:MAG: hypothetical protein JXR64_03960, partial [Spirochaetales bacterium]|nr:hypothetical protein [Spirochaetales bacterium]